jgi:hypothetical protein
MTYAELLNEICQHASHNPEVLNQDVTVFDETLVEFIPVESLKIETDGQETSGVLDVGHIYFTITT